MPYITQLPASFLTLDADLGVIDIGNNNVLNNLNSSQSFDIYDVDATTGTTLSRGDNLTAALSDGTPVVEGVYAGSGTFSTQATTIGVPGLASLTIQINPVDGHFVQGNDGNAYFISDTSLTGNNLGVTITGTILGQSANFIDIPINELGNIPGLGLVLTPVMTAVNNILNTALVNVAYNPDGTLVLDDDDVFPCFVLGTLIRTENGEVPVETLAVGDMVATRDHGLRPILWIGSRLLNAAVLAANPQLRPIRIRAGALGDNSPSSDLLVSPQHRVLVRSRIAQKMFGTTEILVAAKQLLFLDGIDIAEDVDSVEYFHFLFDQHEVVISNGAETESLYTGSEALKAIGKAAQAEIFALFPELHDRDYTPAPARMLASGRMGRKLAVRHALNGKTLVQ